MTKRRTATRGLNSLPHRKTRMGLAERDRSEWSCGSSGWLIIIIIIITRNTYMAPNPARLAQSTAQFKVRMHIRINT